MFIAGLGTATPSTRYTQTECWDALRHAAQFHALDRRARATLEKVLLGDNGIRTRHLALDPLAEVFGNDPDALHARYVRHAPQLAAQAAHEALRQAAQRASDVDALIISTCTGRLCPGLTSYVAERLGCRFDILALDLVGQGCGAALPNLRTAEALLAARRCDVVLSICVEICSAAYYLDSDPGVLVSACLFADGAGAAVLSNSPRIEGRSIAWKSASSLHDPGERDSLRFEQRSGMLRNVLTPQVPELAARYASQVLNEALQSRELKQSEIVTWIWHGGGKRVLDRLCDEIGLGAEQVDLSRRVLSEFGNVSSAFVYFVLQQALREASPDGWWWMSSFGAGFSCHGALLEVA